jgi:hypothetical protein
LTQERGRDAFPWNHKPYREKKMDVVIVIVVVILIACWAYENGKKTGSKKGFHVGRERGRRRRRK